MMCSTSFSERDRRSSFQTTTVSPSRRWPSIRCNSRQQEALQIVFSGQAGGTPARLSAIWGSPQGSRPSSWWKFETEGEASRVQRRWVESARRSARWRGARSTAWRIVLRPECRYQALRLWRTAARLRGLTAALRPSFWHPCRSTAQWIAWNWLGRARDLPGIGGSGRSQFGHDLNLQIAVLQLPFIVLLEQYRTDQPNDGGLIGEDADDVGAPLDLFVEPLERIGAV